MQKKLSGQSEIGKRDGFTISGVRCVVLSRQFRRVEILEVMCRFRASSCRNSQLGCDSDSGECK